MIPKSSFQLLEGTFFMPFLLMLKISYIFVE